MGRGGETGAWMSRRANTIETIMSRIESITESGCMIWMGATQDKGYGTVKWNGKTARVHRLIYTLLKGTIPLGMTLDHLCRVRCCVNPDHLEVVTGKENTLRGIGLSAIHARKTHCIHGHNFTEKAVCMYEGARVCIACQYIRNWSHRAK